MTQNFKLKFFRTKSTSDKTNNHAYLIAKQEKCTDAMIEKGYFCKINIKKLFYCKPCYG